MMPTRRPATVLLLAATVAGGWRLVASVPETAVSAPWPHRLSETGLYRSTGDEPREIDPAVRPFSPQYPLWSDGALKRRWIYLPPGTTIDGSNETSWTFPVGTRFWKEFQFGGRPVETRVSWQFAPGRWALAAYAWNAAGTEATLAPEDGVPGAAPLAGGRQHAIPSRTDCTACHGTTNPAPLGFGALQLSSDRDPNAVHAEALEPGMLTLERLVASGRITGARPDIVSRPPRIATSRTDTRAALGYLYGNCAHCHNGRGEIAALAPVLREAELLADGDVVAASLVRQTTWQIPGVGHGETRALSPGLPERSALLVRMRSRRPSSQMPPLGTVVRDDDALAMLQAWIGRQ